MTAIRGRLDRSSLHPGSSIPTGYPILIPGRESVVTIARFAESSISGPSREERALIDTGSTDTVVHPQLAKDLGLQATDYEEKAYDVDKGQEVPSPIYHVCLTISARNGDVWTYAEWSDLYVAERPNPYSHLFRLIIGNDILQSCRFTYDGPAGSFALELPEESVPPYVRVMSSSRG